MFLPHLAKVRKTPDPEMTIIPSCCQKFSMRWDSDHLERNARWLSWKVQSRNPTLPCGSLGWKSVWTFFSGSALNTSLKCVEFQWMKSEQQILEQDQLFMKILHSSIRASTVSSPPSLFLDPCPTCSTISSVSQPPPCLLSTFPPLPKTYSSSYCSDT